MQADLDHQRQDLEALAIAAQITQYAHGLLERMARAELEQRRSEAAAAVTACQDAREAAWAVYGPHAQTLTVLEGRLAEAHACQTATPDITETTLTAWREAEAAQVANDHAIIELTERIALTRSLLDPMITANGQARDALEAAEDELRGVDNALESDDVFGTPPGMQTRAFQAYLLHSGLWRSDPRSPIGQEWLRRSGAGAS